MFKKPAFVVFLIVAMFLSAACSPASSSNAQVWGDMFTSPEFDPLTLETLPDAVNEWLGQRCPGKQDFDVDGTGEVYTICRDSDDDVIEVTATDFVGLATLATPIPFDDVVAVKWAWDAERATKVIKVVLLAVAAEEAVRAAGVVYSRHSLPDHDPRFSQKARDAIQDISNRISQKLSDPNTTPWLYCAIAIYQNGATYVRVLYSEDGTTGTMGWFGSQGWVGAFSGKDVQGFLNGVPRGATSYNPNLPLQDCLNAIGGGVPPANQIKP